MRKITSFVFSIAIVIFIALSCSKNDGGTGGGTGSTGGGNNACSGTAGPLFLAVRTIVQTNCAISGCHTGTSAQSGINFSDNCTIVAQKDRIKIRAVDQSNMPPPPQPPLSAQDKQTISNWVAAGGRFTD